MMLLCLALNLPEVQWAYIEEDDAYCNPRFVGLTPSFKINQTWYGSGDNATFLKAAFRCYICDRNSTCGPVCETIDKNFSARWYCGDSVCQVNQSGVYGVNASLNVRYRIYEYDENCTLLGVREENKTWSDSYTARVRFVRGAPRVLFFPWFDLFVRPRTALALVGWDAPILSARFNGRAFALSSDGCEIDDPLVAMPPSLMGKHWIFGYVLVGEYSNPAALELKDIFGRRYVYNRVYRR